jgi:hypothetical protein
MRHNSYCYGRRGDELYYAEHKPHARLTRAAVQPDIGPPMCARYSLTKEQITMLIGEIEVSDFLLFALGVLLWLRWSEFCNSPQQVIEL